MSEQPSGAEKIARTLGEKSSSFFKRGEPKDTGPAIEMVPREFPKGAMIHKYPVNRASEVVISIPTHLRTWWVLAYVLAPFLLLLAIGGGLLFGIVEPSWYQDSRGRNQYSEGYFTIMPLLIAIVATIIVLLLIYYATNPTTKITITPKTITIGKYRFEREHVNGMRMGYEVSYDNGTTSPFVQSQIFFTGLRISYGPWGEDLPYMVSKYHGPEYVNWINSILDYVGSPEPRATAPEEGRREQRF